MGRWDGGRHSETDGGVEMTQETRSGHIATTVLCRTLLSDNYHLNIKIVNRQSYNWVNSSNLYWESM